MRVKIAPFLLPEDHPIKSILDKIFLNTRVTSNTETLKNAGFKILHAKEGSFIIVAKHPQVPGYVFKIYTDSENRTRHNKPTWECLLDRCKGSANIKKLINQYKIKYFSVADKWLYPLPPIPASGVQHPVILVATDMNIASMNKTRDAWLNCKTKHLDELYIILSHHNGSSYLSHNVPYTKNGKFAFIDTENPDRKVSLSRVKLFIRAELHSYWDKLMGK